MDKLKIITSTTRPGRKGISIAKWLHELAQQTGKFDSEILDLAEINLPFMDEPNHPRLQKYEHEHTRNWSSRIDSGDAFIVVLGEYNFGFPAPIKNAMDFLYKEWMYKPVAFASYGGVSAGLRATQMLKQVVTAMHMLPLTDSVSIPSFARFINEEGEFKPDEMVEKSANALFIQLERYCEASKVLRKG